MLKKIALLAMSLTLFSCKENNKVIVQDLLNQKNFVDAKVLVESMLKENSKDSYYNSAYGYILSVECFSKNCAKNNPEDLNNIKKYIFNDKGLVKIADLYYVDLYPKSIGFVIDSALKLENSQQAVNTIAPFVKEVENKRTSYVYKYMYNRFSQAILRGESKRGAFILDVIRKLEISTPEDEILNNVLYSALKGDSETIVKEKVSSLNRHFIDKKISKEFLVIFTPVMSNYLLDHAEGSLLDSFGCLSKTRSRILGRNISVLRREDNNDYFAKGVEIIAKSNLLLEKIEKRENISKEDIANNLNKISLMMNYDNADLWNTYIKSNIERKTFKDIYKGFSIEKLDSKIVISNNNLILDYAEKNLEKDSVISQIDEIVFREDSNKEFFTNRTVEIVEKAIQHEIDKDNLERVFEYFNYFPGVKGKFRDQMSKKIRIYIDEAWQNNDFSLLSRLLKLDQELEGISISKVLHDLFDSEMKVLKNQKIFYANSIDEMVSSNGVTHEENVSFAEKYKFVESKLNRDSLRGIIFANVRNVKGDYTKAKTFMYFKDIFSKKEGESLILDSLEYALSRERGLSLVKLVELSNYISDRLGYIPTSFVKSNIASRIKGINDLNVIWNNMNDVSKKSLSKYDKDIKSFMNIMKKDKKGQKISAALDIEKIKSPKMLKLSELYRNIYTSYIDQIQGFYVKEDGKKGPEVIKISKTKNLLKVKLNFISRLGHIEKLTKYKLDRGEVINTGYTSYYNPVNGKIKYSKNYTKKEGQVFLKANSVSVKGQELEFAGQKYKKVNNLFEFGKNYGIIDQLTILSDDNFHIMPEGTSFTVVKKLGKDSYRLQINHPANQKPVIVNAKYNPVTLDFEFEYDYRINALDKRFDALAKCQLLDFKAYCAVQSKHWKREKFSVILKALQVK